jgi:hypothetical protein
MGKPSAPLIILIIIFIGSAALFLLNAQQQDDSVSHDDVIDETEPVKRFCGPESRNADACIALYDPVCGWSDPGEINCIAFPCASTYSNSCVACSDDTVLYWTEGECPEPN